MKNKLWALLIMISTSAAALASCGSASPEPQLNTEDMMVITAIDLGAENTGEAAMQADGKGNTAEVIENYNVGTVYLPPADYAYRSDEDYYKHEQSYVENIIAAAEKRGTEIVYMEAGQEFPVGSIKAKILYCNGSTYSENWYDVQYFNNQSSVILFSGGGSKYLTGGDIQKQAEKRILKSGQSVEADIFKISHHGYDRSNWQDFVNKVNPTYSYFTANKPTETTYMHEDIQDSVTRMEALSNVMSTRYNGTITYTCSDGEITVEAERNIIEMYQLLTDKETGETRKIKLVFNDAAPIHLTKKMIDTDRYDHQRINADGSVYEQ